MSTEHHWVCPVCHYPHLRENPLEWTHEICPGCGTQFGYDDAGRTHEELRAEWIKSGSHWWARRCDERKPEVWPPK